MMVSKIKKDDTGSALIVAIVAGVVVITFSLLLLLVAYSLFSTANGQQMGMTGRELSQSIANELTAEIVNPQFGSLEERNQAYDSGAYRLWFFLRYNVWNTYNWPDISASEPQYNSPYKYFKMNVGSQHSDLVDDVTVKFSWEKADELTKEGTKLYMNVAVTDKGVVYETSRTFILETDMVSYLPKEVGEETIFDGGSSDGQDGSEGQEGENQPPSGTPGDGQTDENGESENEKPGTPTVLPVEDVDLDDVDEPKVNPYQQESIVDDWINPNNNPIYIYEKWSWSLNE